MTAPSNNKRFRFTGFDKAGSPTNDTIEAADKNEALEALRRRGIFVSEVTEADAEKSGGGGGGGDGEFFARLRARAARLDNVATFTRQLSLLVSTGTPLVEALTSLEHQTQEGPFHDVLAAMRQRVEEGAQLSDAMGHSSAQNYFDAVCISLVRAGEQGGKLDVMLQRLSSLIRQQVKVRKTVKGAMVYPALLICIAVVVVCAMLGFVLPRFEGLFKTLDTPLPPTTKFLMSASAVLRAYWWAFLGGGAAVATALKFYLSSVTGRARLDAALTTIPTIGPATRSFNTARIARMLGTLLDGKVPLLEALTLTRQSVSNSLYTDLLQRAEDAVMRGENISTTLANPTLIVPSVCDALKSGERNGQMAPVLTSVAQYLDEDNEVLVKTLTGLLEPVILIIMGLIVGVMAISMFLPLFDLTSATGAGGGGG